MAPSRQSVAERARMLAIAVLDAITFAAALTGAVFGLALAVAVGSGGSAARTKLVMFLVGWLLMAYAVVRLWPSSPGADPEQSTRTEPSLPERNEIRFQRVSRALPPVRWLTLPPPEHRIRIPAQVFLASVFILATSLALEVVFGVQ